VVNFRFTVIGFYLAFLGLVVSQYNDSFKEINRFLLCAVIVIITIFVWFLDLRTRVLYNSIGFRGYEIEMDLWKFEKNAGSHPFYTHMMKIEKNPNESSNDIRLEINTRFINRRHPNSIKIFSFSTMLIDIITYSIAIDFLILCVISGSISMVVYYFTHWILRAILTSIILFAYIPFAFFVYSKLQPLLKKA
jgi:hypothetical protein